LKQQITSRLHNSKLHINSTPPAAAAGKGAGGGGSSRGAGQGASAHKQATGLQHHPLVRLQRGVDQIRPLLQATRQLQAAVTVEQAWWVGLLVRYRTEQVVDPAAWQQLLDALDAFVHR
jgi:hypothetical protein